MPVHHPSENVLMEYAAGGLGEAYSMVVATHLALCPECRERVAEFEALGGALLETLPEEPMDPGTLDALLARLDLPADPEPHAPPLRRMPRRPDVPPVLPEPLRSYVGVEFPDVPWRHVMRGLDEYEIPIAAGSGKTKLMRIGGGIRMPRHTHKGSEMTLVLAGAFSDELGHFERGDLSLTDTEIDHRPTADPGEDCICIAVTDAPLKLTGAFGRLVNPFVRI